MKLSLVVAAVSAAVVPVTDLSRHSTFSLCGDSSDILQISDVQFTPNPINQGDHVDMRLIGVTSAALTTGAKVKALLKYNSFTVYDETLDFCADASGSNNNNPCPIAAGPLNFVHGFHIPKMSPGGTYKGVFMFKNGDGAQIACVKAVIYL